jgi:hypothetical protein
MSMLDGGFQAVRAVGQNLQIRTLLKKQKRFLLSKFWDFLTIWWKAPLWLVENQNKKKEDGYLGDPARGQADPGSARCTVHHGLAWSCDMYVCTSMYVWERCPTHSNPQIHLL